MKQLTAEEAITLKAQGLKPWQMLTEEGELVVDAWSKAKGQERFRWHWYAEAEKRDPGVSSIPGLEDHHFEWVILL